MTEQHNEIEEPPGCSNWNPSLTRTFHEINEKIAGICPHMAQGEEWRDIYYLLKDAEEQPGSSLKPRTEEYIRENIAHFITLYDGEALVSCGEIITVDRYTLELGAVATNREYRSQGMSNTVIEFAENHAKMHWKTLIIVTDNPILTWRLVEKKYVDVTVLYTERSNASPGKKIYIKITP